jgi:putative two-component system response regulator
MSAVLDRIHNAVTLAMPPTVVSRPERPLRSEPPDLQTEAQVAYVGWSDDFFESLQEELDKLGVQHVLPCRADSHLVEQLRSQAADVILLEAGLAESRHAGLLQALLLEAKLQNCPVVVVAQRRDIEQKRRCLEIGCHDFLVRPFETTELALRLRHTLEAYWYCETLRRRDAQFEEAVRRRTEDLALSRMELVQCLARAAEFRDDVTGNHVVRVGKFVRIIARELGFSEAHAELLDQAAQLHDVGKIAIPDSILKKPGPLEPDQFELMRKHTAYGKQVLCPFSAYEQEQIKSHTRLGNQMLTVRSSPLMMLAARIAQTHHERWDGTGYPLGLAGEDIPLEGRMTAVADVYDALSTERPYKQAMPRQRCFEIMEQGRGTHFDPRVLDAFFRRSEDITRIQMQYMDDVPFMGLQAADKPASARE